MRASTVFAGAWAVARAARAPRAVSFANQTVVLSGGSRGLGLLIARRLIDEGAQVALLARTEADLDAAVAELGPDALAVVCDVRDRAAVDAAVQRIADELGPPSVLLHDAGVISVGPEAHMTEADYTESLGIHFWGAYHLTEAVRPFLPRDGSARIGYVSSIGGRVAIPHLGPYSVGKHALVGYADAMRAELAADGIRVTTITPGLMRTGSHPNAQIKGQHEKEYAWFAIGDATPLVSMDGDRAARKILDALRHGDAALTLTLAAKIAAAVDGVAPGVVGVAMKAVTALLPAPAGPTGDHRQTGWESTSPLAPSLLTALADQNVAPNNELRGHVPPGD
ncbi:MAG TPA: SDR family oxidoreductase [Rubricoccaceae bacterium]